MPVVEVFSIMAGIKALSSCPVNCGGSGSPPLPAS